MPDTELLTTPPVVAQIFLCIPLAAGTFTGLFAFWTAFTRFGIPESRGLALGVGAASGLIGAGLGAVIWFVTDVSEPLPYVVWLFIGALTSVTTTNAAAWLLNTVLTHDRTVTPRVSSATGNEIPGGN